MRSKVCSEFGSAINEVKDGASIMMFCWGVSGTPQNLIYELYKKGVKDLTIICHNFLPAFINGEILWDVVTPYILSGQVRKLITAWPGSSILGIKSQVEEKIKKGEIELELMSHGVLIQRILAGGNGMGGFYSPVGVGTIMEKNKEKKIIEGREYLLEMPLRADFSFIRAHKADALGNLVYHGGERASNPIMAMASDVTIAEVDHLVGIGEINPDDVVTPGIFVDRIVKVPQGGRGSEDDRKRRISKIFGGKNENHSN